MTDLDLTNLREIANAYRRAIDASTVLALIDEIERLRRWKREAKQVLKGLGNLAKVADAPLGHSIIEAAIDEIERLRETLATVKAITVGTPECDKYDDKSPVTCGWKFDLQRIKEVVK